MFSKTLTAVLTLSTFAFAAGPFVLNTPYVFGILVPERAPSQLFVSLGLTLRDVSLRSSHGPAENVSAAHQTLPPSTDREHRHSRSSVLPGTSPVAYPSPLRLSHPACAFEQE